MSAMRDPGGVHPDSGDRPNPPSGDGGSGWILLLLLWLGLTAYGLQEFLRLLGVEL